MMYRVYLRDGQEYWIWSEKKLLQFATTTTLISRIEVVRR